MDDEALARALQAEELAAARAAAAAQFRNVRGEQASAQFAAQVEANVRKVLGYEQEAARRAALAVMPLARLRAAAAEGAALSAAMGESLPLAEEDALALELLLWFKSEFFTWVNSPPCAACSGATASAGAAAPSPQEAAHLAGRTELHRCTQCGATTRFPRYNDPVKLLETRRGRCGEWANCFTLCCRAAGLEARLVMDWEDHIWSEYRSAAQRRWVHLDPCEAAADKPLLYEAGWGKQLSYVLAVGRHGVADVTRRYTRQYEQRLARRTLVSEAWLADFVRHVTGCLRVALPPEARRRLEARDEEERAALAAGAERPPAEGDAALPARQTGDAAWLAARGEDGTGGVRGAPRGAAPPPPGTRYRWARDDALAARNPRRLAGGAVRASGENAPSETAVRAFDGQPGTKWLDFGGPGPGGAWLEYRLPADAPAAVLAAYALTSANDCPERDPRHVVLEAWDEAAGAWVPLDEQRALTFPARGHRLVLRVAGGAAGPPPARRFRLRVAAVAGPGANSVQLACCDLYALKRVALQAGQEGQPAPAQEAGGEPAAAAQRLAALQLQPGRAGGQVAAQQPPQQQQEPAEPAASAPAAPAQPALAPPADSPAGGGGAAGQPAAEPENPWAALFGTPPPS